jgi:hypothetical protein
MNRERAETYLRLLAEKGLREVAAQPSPSAPQGPSAPVGHPDQWTYEPLARVTQALALVHAVDDSIAEEILADFDLALAVRQPGGLSQVIPEPAGRQRGRPVLMRRPPLTGTVAPLPQLRAPAESWRLTPVGHVIGIGGDGGSGEIHLLAFAQTVDAAWFTVASWLVVPEMDEPSPSPGRPPPPRPTPPFQHFTVTDDQGVGYQLGFGGGGSSGRGTGCSYAEWEGALDLRPNPAHQIRWLDLSAPGQPVMRIDLTPQLPPDVVLTQTSLTPGEVLLDKLAASLLAQERVASQWRQAPTSADGPGDMIAALQASGVLPAASPVPGGLAWLFATLSGDTGGAAPPAGVPEPWLSMLAHHQRRAPSPAVPGGQAAVAFELPELDGIRIAVLGLHNGQDGTIVHLLATGVTMTESWAGSGGNGPMPALWLRDHRGQWHTTRMKGSNSAQNGGVTLRLMVVPPLDHNTPWLELRATGLRAQVRLMLPLRWT